MTRGREVFSLFEMVAGAETTEYKSDDEGRPLSEESEDDRGGREAAVVEYNGSCGEGRGDEENERDTPSRSFGDERSQLATDDEALLPACDDESFLSFCLLQVKEYRGQLT